MNRNVLKSYADEISAAARGSKNCIDVVVKAYGMEPVDTVKTDVSGISMLSDEAQNLIAADYRKKHGYPDNVSVGIWDARFLRIVKGGE